MAKARGMVVGRQSRRGARGADRGERRVPPPLDAAALDRMALRYVERYATTRGKLIDYLRRKLRERGWEGERPADPESVADAHVAAGHVDDAGYARAKAGSLSRRGYGERRIDAALRSHRVGDEDRDAALDALPDGGVVAALRLLRRRRLGPFAAATPDDGAARRTLAVLMRAGHHHGDARAALSLSHSDAEAAIEEASAVPEAGAWGTGH